ncbi:methyl-accepting chemotaxis protein [Sporomusa acidovorans]|uniref:Methyl-accepting chemotaxis protein McpA n=1 Tax=Sporomusa acidovorans (strain ATCC 49682 / DSM 3132 / Mol) TaxID=1123286 RepID=A0ABZ3IZY4_SPOA4|nr:methyl-accepting chemotaxis protein [Sporomusa acidovorans]OZC21372.1 methyl-accepting chemotaxis protein McpA [Sporomusa acidovorans DSM 3132]SDE56034.1 methyl-accepting chemotaxis sensory transducer with Cache sensor [Sporomusa acidovorans]
MKSLQAKLMLIIISIILIALGTLGGLSYWKTSQLLFTNTEESAVALTQNSAEQAGLWINAHKSEISMLAHSTLITSGNIENIVPFLKSVNQANKDYISIVFIQLDGTFYDSAGFTGNIAHREYFQRAIKGETVITDPLISVTVGLPFVAIVVPVEANGKIIGCLSGTVSLENFSKQIVAVKIGETGYAFAVQGNGLVIVHPNHDYVLKQNSITDHDSPPPVKAVIEKMISGENGYSRYTYAGVDKLIAYAPIPGVSWSLGITVPTQEITGKLNQLTVIIGVITLAVLLFAVIAVVIFTKRMIKPIKKVEAAANQIADGDITVSSVGITSDDELGHLGQSFEKMTANLRVLIREISSAVEQVATSSKELTASAEQSAQAANQVAGSITEVAQGAEKQLGLVNISTKVVEQMSQGIGQVVENTAVVSAAAEKTARAANDGEQAIEKAINQMTVIEQKTTDTALVIGELEEKSQYIGQIVETISNIAGQTNLLALNAAIEAARAGEQGRGFAVVADEVRKLAEQSREAAKQIAELIGEVQQRTNNAVTFMDQGRKEVTVGTEVVNVAGQNFRNILVMIQNMTKQISEISAAIQQVANGSRQVVDAIQEINTESKNTAGEAQTVSAATEEQSASMQQISSASQSLDKMAEKLQQAIYNFKV